MDLKLYIESGVLELYAMDALGAIEKAAVEELLVLYPEIVQELARIQEAMERYAQLKAVPPKPRVMEQLLDSIENLTKEKTMLLTDLPIINKYTNHENWLRLVREFGELSVGSNGRFIKVLRNDQNVTQMLVVSTTDIEEEIHHHERESFLILEGQCQCTIGDEVKDMFPGDFMYIPMYEAHHVEIISPKVTAILQHIKL